MTKEEYIKKWHPRLSDLYILDEEFKELNPMRHFVPGSDMHQFYMKDKEFNEMCEDYKKVIIK